MESKKPIVRIVKHVKIFHTLENAERMKRTTSAKALWIRWINGKILRCPRQKQNQSVDKYTFSYDPVGNKTGINKIRTGILQENGNFQYEYIPLNQLSRVFRNGEILREFNYDAFGNRIFKKEGIIKTNYFYNKNNQLIREKGQDTEEYQYDLRVNLKALILKLGKKKDTLRKKILN